MPLPSASMRDRLAPIFLGQGFAIVCGILGVRLTSAIVPADVFGRYGIFLTFTPLGMWVVHAGLIKFTVRHWASAPDRAALLRVIAKAAARKLPWLCLATAAAAVVIAGRDWWHIWPFLAASTVLLSGAAIAQTALQAERAHWRDSAVLGASAVTRSFVPPLLYAATAGSAFSLYTGHVLHAMVFAAAGTWALRNHLRPQPASAAGPVPVPAVYQGPLFALLAIVSWALAGVTRWTMAAHFGAVETGYFTLASNLASLVPSVLGTIFLLYFQPSFFAAPTDTHEQRRQLFRQVDRAAVLHAILAAAALVGLHAVAPLLVGPVIQEPYRRALVFLLPTGAFALATVTALFYHTVLLAGHRERACGPVDLWTAGILIAGCLASAAAGQDWFIRWLWVTPAIPWVLSRPLARRALLGPPERRLESDA